MLKFAKSVPYIPDPARSRPHITDEQRASGAETPPQPMPYHCKPWVDGQALGWTLFYGYLSPIEIVGVGAGNIEVVGLEQLAAETQQPKIVHQFAPGHFGIGCGLTLRTPPALNSLIIPAANPPANLRAVTGLIESDWYPRQLFLVFESPMAGQTIKLDYEMALARVVLVPRHDGWDATELAASELVELERERQQYLADEADSPSSWTAANGETFTKVYKQWSRRLRQ